MCRCLSSTLSVTHEWRQQRCWVRKCVLFLHWLESYGCMIAHGYFRRQFVWPISWTHVNAFPHLCFILTHAYVIAHTFETACHKDRNISDAFPNIFIILWCRRWGIFSFFADVNGLVNIITWDKRVGAALVFRSGHIPHGKQARTNMNLWSMQVFNVGDLIWTQFCLRKVFMANGYCCRPNKMHCKVYD